MQRFVAQLLIAEAAAAGPYYTPLVTLWVFLTQVLSVAIRVVAEFLEELGREVKYGDSPAEKLNPPPQAIPGQAKPFVNCTMYASNAAQRR